MPATTNGKPSTGRFELPQLTPINYSLTDGTGIPPPPDSPIEEYVPASENSPSATTANGQSATATNNNQKNGGSGGEGGAYEGRGRTNTTTTADEQQPPMSPASSTRQGSIRRFLSRKSLNTNYTNGTNTNASQEDLSAGARPESAMSFASQRPSLAKKKSGSWFKRLGSSNGSKRTSIIYEDKKPVLNSAPSPAVKKGPPPPKLPELNQLKAKIADNDEGSLGAEDMFKNIK
ncbi:hypothetical protein IFR05_006813 [Cadophora sp. M221]|nr:hypothetical protein IFR05_006813 [Cadophora sp. M221]